MRTEKDFIGTVEIPATALYGIHSYRASLNFPDSAPFNLHWYRAVGKVKHACYETVINYRSALQVEHADVINRLQLPGEEVLKALISASLEVSAGLHFDQFIVPACQGGAGTSINLNVNEIIANRALQFLGHVPGEYTFIDPIETANIYQSTNDVIPSALTVAVMELLKVLEESVNLTRKETERLEHEHRSTLRVSFTQLQEAVPGTYGQLFSNYSDALSRDWWRVSKAFERIKQVNLGGGATGIPLSLPRFYIMEVVPELRKITGLPIAQAENLSDCTSNFDALVEVHAILKANAVNLEKLANDMRLLSSGLPGEKEVHIPERQTGSSIMPGKVNPVIPEFIISSAHQVYSNDMQLATLAARGELDLNAFLPSMGHLLLQSLELLIAMNQTLRENLLKGLTINKELAASRLLKSPSVTTVIAPLTGYNRAATLAAEMKSSSCNIYEANKKLGLIDHASLEKMLQPEFLLKKGFSVQDIREIEKTKE